LAPYHHSSKINYHYTFFFLQWHCICSGIFEAVKSGLMSLAHVYLDIDVHKCGNMYSKN
jgi:hypothetical protein